MSLDYKDSCVYYAPLDYWKGGMVVECKKTKEFIEECPPDCKYYKYNPNYLEDMVCLDLSTGTAIEDCEDCSMDCDDRNYFEKVS